MKNYTSIKVWEGIKDGIKKVVYAEGDWHDVTITIETYKNGAKVSEVKETHKDMKGWLKKWKENL